MDGGAWWAAVHGVAQSWTRLNDFTFTFSLSCIGEGNGNPLQYSCLENPRDRGVWWAAICGVAQSRTRLKWLGSSRDLFKKIRDPKETFHAKMGTIKDRNGMDLTESEDIKRVSFRGNAFNFSPLRIMLLWVYHTWLLLCWGMFLLCLLSRGFLS